MTVTSVPVVRAVAEFRAAGRSVATILGWILFAAAWLVAKTCRLLMTTAGAVLFAAGYLGGKVIWPGLRWSATAVRLGWDEGRKPVGGRRGAA